MTHEVYRDYSLKPAVRIGSYFFKWSDNNYGICPSESSVFKNFIRKMIPLLEHYMNILNFEYKNNSQNKKLLGDKKHHICIVEKYDKNVSFIVLIDSAGSTLFYREEKFHVGSKDIENPEEVREEEKEKVPARFVLQTRDDNNNKMTKNNNIVSLKWLLGELLFDRLKTTN